MPLPRDEERAKWETRGDIITLIVSACVCVNGLIAGFSARNSSIVAYSLRKRERERVERKKKTAHKQALYLLHQRGGSCEFHVCNELYMYCTV